MYWKSIVFCIVMVFMFLWQPFVFAQEYPCPELVQIAFDATDEACIDTGLNRVCYGHSVIEIDPRVDSRLISFSEPGNEANIVQIEKIRLSAMDIESGAWGVALMNLQAYVGNTRPEDVTFLMFGDVEIENLVDPDTTILLSTMSDAQNLYLAPTFESEIIETLANDSTVKAKQRLADSSWLRVEVFPSGLVGWMPQSAFSPAPDLDVLQVIEAWEPYYGPMQAFYFKSGQDDSLCPEAPESGLLIQTPEGVAEVNLIINEVNIQLSSTAFVQAQPNGNMTVEVVDGWATVENGAGSQTITSGQQVTVPLNNNLQPQGAPSVTQSSNNPNLLPSIAANPVASQPPTVFNSSSSVAADYTQPSSSIPTTNSATAAGDTTTSTNSDSTSANNQTETTTNTSNTSGNSINGNSNGNAGNGNNGNGNGGGGGNNGNGNGNGGGGGNNGNGNGNGGGNNGNGNGNGGGQQQ